MTDLLDGQENVFCAIKDAFDPLKDAKGDEDDVLEGLQDVNGYIGNVLGDQTDGRFFPVLGIRRFDFCFSFRGYLRLKSLYFLCVNII